MKKKTIIIILLIAAAAFLVYRYFIFGYGSQFGKYDVLSNPMGSSDPFGFTGPGKGYDGFDYQTGNYYKN